MITTPEETTRESRRFQLESLLSHLALRPKRERLALTTHTRSIELIGKAELSLLK